MATRTDIHQLEGQLALMKDDIDRKDAIIHDLSVKNKQLEDRLKRVEGVVDTLQLNQRNARFHSINNEQYQRKNNLVIFGIKEADKEDVKAAAVKVMKTCAPTVTVADVDVAHRLGNRKVGGKPRPVIVKMYSHDVRFNILKTCKALRGVRDTGVPLSIGKDICKEYQELLSTITAAGLKCWYWNTRVWIQRSDGSSISVQVQDNWQLKINDFNIPGRPARQ